MRAQRGDRAAFEKIVHATARMVYAQIVASVRDRQRAEDLTQETFVAAWKSLASVEKPAGFSAWLLTLARNGTLDAIKFESRKKRGGNLKLAGHDAAAAGEGAVAAANPADLAELSESRDQALRMLEELPEEYKRPLAMRYLGGADYETIRTVLAISDGALRGLLNRGMAILRERMTKAENK